MYTCTCTFTHACTYVYIYVCTQHNLKYLCKAKTNAENVPRQKQSSKSAGKVKIREKLLF